MGNQQRFTETENFQQHPVHPNLLVAKDGRVYSKKRGRLLTPSMTSTGYHQVYVMDTKRSRKLHRLVAETFLRDSEHYGRDVNHKDGNKLNNKVENLEWCTRSHNIRHAINNGLNPSRGETHPCAVSSEREIREVCELLQSKLTNLEIEKLTGIGANRVANIRNGSVWSEISKEYQITPAKSHTRKTEATIHQVCQLLVSGLKVREVAETTGIPEWDVRRIKRGAVWKSVSEQYFGKAFNDYPERE